MLLLITDSGAQKTRNLSLGLTEANKPTKPSGNSCGEWKYNQVLNAKISIVVIFTKGNTKSMPVV